MAVLSLLRAAQLSCQSLKTPLSRWSVSLLPKTNICQGTVRQMSHGRKMAILPTRYDYTRWKDAFHFYLALGLIPIGATVFLSNLFIGNAELIDIPEGYHPEHWEYYKHPITRTFSKYLIDKPEKSYEVHLHAVYEEQQKTKMRALEKKVKRLMAGAW
ncbi:hypothetical protein NP493_159g04053 [Ridgeia piscesae]|uniref:NADH dehydrogenase [ubiquinone] 1 beta subcomplex subunit 5, mitochondrial n=1 Tax=Ridgeia piscesae TaxID=27915 RepID=A0AAD9P3V2_RIDPI|nr:hypothetical protein NP493_159g04053 [Ridgeia piscesae]